MTTPPCEICTARPARVRLTWPDGRTVAACCGCGFAAAQIQVKL